VQSDQASRDKIALCRKCSFLGLDGMSEVAWHWNSHTAYFHVARLGDMPCCSCLILTQIFRYDLVIKKLGNSHFLDHLIQS
jgi:hypothetical protein